MNWRDGYVWRGIGYGLTAAWMVAVLVMSGGDPADPMFDYIFIVPLIGWLIAVPVVRWIAHRNQSGPPDIR